MTGDFPTPRDALALAFEIVRTPCSAAETQRAEVLLGIAKELREEQQFKATRSILTNVVKPTPGYAGETASARVERIVKDFQETARSQRGLVELRTPQVGDRIYAENMVPAPPRAWVDPSVTQQMPIVWSVGDKADCRHCHTPIELGKWPTTVGGDPVNMEGWRHKYTGQSACAIPTMSGGCKLVAVDSEHRCDDPVAGSLCEYPEVTHTFAAPGERRSS